MPDCTYVHTDKTNGTKTPCQHQAYGKESLCVFHSADVRAKSSDFHKALDALLDQAYASDEPLDLNFKGFVFPKVDFRYYEFRGNADFRSAVFTDDADFQGGLFRQQADFHTTEFHYYAGFSGAKFHGIARFLGTQF